MHKLRFLTLGLCQFLVDGGRQQRPPDCHQYREPDGGTGVDDQYIVFTDRQYIAEQITHEVNSDIAHQCDGNQPYCQSGMRQYAEDRVAGQGGAIA